MHKLLFPFLAVGALSVALSACDAQVGPSAAKVNSTTITRGTLVDSMNAEAGSTGFRCVLGTSMKIKGTGANTYSTAFSAAVLSLLIENEALHEQVVRLKLPIGPIGKQLATQELGSALAPPSGSTCDQSGATVVSSLPASYRAMLIGLQENQDALAAHLAGTTLTTAGIKSFTTAHPKAAQLACVAAIETETAAQAQAALAKIKAGASFASVAKTSSLDTTTAASGGSLGCILPSQLASPLNTTIEQLPVGQVSAPISFSGAFVLFLVSSRVEATGLQAASAVVQSAGAKASALITKVLGSASVSVDPQYGTWKKVSTEWQVAPPTGPPAKLVPNISAATGSS